MLLLAPGPDSIGAKSHVVPAVMVKHERVSAKSCVMACALCARSSTASASEPQASFHLIGRASKGPRMSGAAGPLVARPLRSAPNRAVRGRGEKVGRRLARTAH